jgi:hypothetical protein
MVAISARYSAEVTAAGGGTATWLALVRTIIRHVPALVSGCPSRAPTGPPAPLPLPVLGSELVGMSLLQRMAARERTETSDATSQERFMSGGLRNGTCT